MPIALDVPATDEGFDECGYLAANPDVRDAVRAGVFRNGREHFDRHGNRESRRLRFPADVFREAQLAKLARVEPLLRLEMPHVRRGHKYDFLTQELRDATGIVDTDAVSSNSYGRETQALIDGLPHGLVLDCGAGQRPVYFENVVNYEIVDFDTTDIIGVGESLPFKDSSFDGVVSIAVLEHVRDPFRCASEIVRVLKPGGKLMCCVPFLQPLHGYPHHYYNMSHQGLAALFAGDLVIDRQLVDESVRPIWSLTWIVTKWAEGLSGEARDEFLAMPLGELLKQATELSDRSWVRDLPEVKNFELASATILLAHKPV
jgi:SAM-dependent methyltransferase